MLLWILMSIKQTIFVFTSNECSSDVSDSSSLPIQQKKYFMKYRLISFENNTIFFIIMLIYSNGETKKVIMRKIDYIPYRLVMQILNFSCDTFHHKLKISGTSRFSFYPIQRSFFGPTRITRIVIYHLDTTKSNTKIWKLGNLFGTTTR